LSPTTPERSHAYRGRFAPSPTGPLHFGSLLAAVASYADALAHAGTWLVRIEDLDRAREVPGAADAILRTLDAFGLHWQEPVLYQSRRTAAYADVLAALRARDLSYPCGCSRGDIAAEGLLGREGPIYPGTCRNGLRPGRRPRSERLRVDGVRIRVEDRVQGPIDQDLAGEVGDFVLRRADGIHAYQLAVVVDDAAQGMTDVVRGADLLSSTPRQVYLQRLLGLSQPRYAHVPVAVDAAGRKLSKSSASTPVDPCDPLPALLHAWRFLGQAVPPSSPASVAEFWQWAAGRWSARLIPKRAARPATKGHPGPL